MPVKGLVLSLMVISLLWGLGKEVPHHAPNPRTDLFTELKILPEETVLKRLRTLHDEALRQKDPEGRTYLHEAVLYKKYRLLRFLVEKIPVYIQDHAGDTPLHLAVKNRDAYAMKLLRLSPSFPVAMQIRNAQNKTPLELLDHTTAREENPDNNVSLFYTLEYRPMVNEPIMQYKDLEDISKEKPVNIESGFQSQTDLHRAKNSGNIEIHVGGD